MEDEHEGADIIEEEGEGEEVMEEKGKCVKEQEQGPNCTILVNIQIFLFCHLRWTPGKF